jgi:YD repeat-containing protein
MIPRSVTTDGGGPTAKTLAYDAAGNLTDDGETYAYEYDAWYRLRKIKDRGTSAVLSEHQYYGNGFRAGEHYDADEDADVDASDPWYWFGTASLDIHFLRNSWTPRHPSPSPLGHPHSEWPVDNQSHGLSTRGCFRELQPPSPSLDSQTVNSTPCPGMPTPAASPCKAPCKANPRLA